jgi:predicted ATP-dependent endonuclease of OLD family
MKLRPIRICALLVAALLSSNAASAQQLDNIRVARSTDSATEARNPKAKNAKSEDFVDSRFVQELDKSGFFAELNKGL